MDHMVVEKLDAEVRSYADMLWYRFRSQSGRSVPLQLSL